MTLSHALEALLVAAPAATVGLAAGVLATYGPASRLLALLNEPAPGTGLVLPLAAAWLVGVAIPVVGTAWPAWVGAGGPVVTQLTGGDVSQTGRFSLQAAASASSARGWWALDGLDCSRRL